MSLRLLKWLTILLPTTIIGGFEIIRHEFLLGYISMEIGNYLIAALTFFIFFLFATWMFTHIQKINKRLSIEQSTKAIYEDRERIARELHDNIAQVLFFLNVMLKQKKIEEAQSAVSELDQHVRQSIFNLRSKPDEDTNFIGRLNNWINEWSEISGIVVNKQIKIPEKNFNTIQEIELFAIIQEAFTNVRKHSKATKASISFIVRENKWYLTIKDNGIGIEELNLNNKKYGLSILNKRVQELNATCNIKKIESGGTEINIQGGVENEI